MTTIRFTEIDASDIEWTIEVRAKYYPYRFGRREEPDEPEHFEIDSITVLEINQDFDEFELSEFLSLPERDIINMIHEKLFDTYESDELDYYDNFINDFD